MFSSPHVKYSPEAKRFEAKCPDGLLDTLFVFPPELKEGDGLPNLYILDVPGASKPFRIMGHFDKRFDSLQFVLYGPKDFFYKMSLQLEAGSVGAPYIWKIKKHGETNGSGFYDQDILHVPRSTCSKNSDLLNAPSDVIKYLTFYDHNVPSHFCKLRLKARIEKGSFQQPPIIHSHVSKADHKPYVSYSEPLRVSSEPKLMLPSVKSKMVDSYGDHENMAESNIERRRYHFDKKPNDKQTQISPNKVPDHLNQIPKTGQTHTFDFNIKSDIEVVESQPIDSAHVQPRKVHEYNITANIDCTGTILVKNVDSHCLVPYSSVEEEDMSNESEDDKTLIVDRDMEVTLVIGNNDTLEKVSKFEERMHVIDSPYQTDSNYLEGQKKLEKLHEKTNEIGKATTQHLGKDNACHQEKEPKYNQSIVKCILDSKPSKEEYKSQEDAAAAHFEMGLEDLVHCILDSSNKNSSPNSFQSPLQINDSKEKGETFQKTNQISETEKPTDAVKSDQIASCKLNSDHNSDQDRNSKLKIKIDSVELGQVHSCVLDLSEPDTEKTSNDPGKERQQNKIAASESPADNLELGPTSCVLNSSKDIKSKSTSSSDSMVLGQSGQVSPCVLNLSKSESSTIGKVTTNNSDTDPEKTKISRTEKTVRLFVKEPARGEKEALTGKKKHWNLSSLKKKQKSKH